MGVSKVRSIEIRLDWSWHILLDPAVPEIFYFKHGIAAFRIIIYIGNPHVDNIIDAILALSSKSKPQLGYATKAF